VDSDRNAVSDADCLSLFNQLQAEMLSAYCRQDASEEEVPRQVVGSPSEGLESSGWENPAQLEPATEVIIASKSDHAYSRKSIASPALSSPSIVNTTVFTAPVNSVPQMESEVTVSPSGNCPVRDAEVCVPSSAPCTTPALAPPVDQPVCQAPVVDLALCSAPAVDMLPSDILDLDSIFEESLNIPNLMEEFEVEQESVSLEENMRFVENTQGMDFKSEDLHNEDSDDSSLYEDAYFPVISQSEVNKSILDSVIPFGKVGHMDICSPDSPIHSDAGYESYGSPSSELSLSDSLAENLNDLFPILI